MKPVWAHSAECGECARPPGEPARTRVRPSGYARLRNRKCPGVTDLAVVSGQLGAKLALTRDGGSDEQLPAAHARGQRNHASGRC